ncbi:MAG: hypothetical protein P1U61_04295 [Legionellaceae bacterium]|nr:hypothetical protein [Legionellaceae bacterium]
MRPLKTIVFGLSGNPPTKNHLLFIQHLLSLKTYDLVRVVLNAQSPLKSFQGYIPAEGRFELLKAMLDFESVDFNRCILERLELERPPPSYMIDTLSALISRAKQQGIDEKITLALGLDALKQFTRWYQWDTYGTLCEVKFYPRVGEEMPLKDVNTSLSPLHEAGIQASVVSFEDEKPHMVAGSSTAARAYYAAGMTGRPDGITEVVDKLIREKGYYGATN